MIQKEDDNLNIENERKEICSKMAIEILEEMKRTHGTSSSNINLETLTSTIEKIKEDPLNYYYCLNDFKNDNEFDIAKFNQIEKIKYEKIKKEIKDKCDFDVIFYKIGEKCNGWKKRYAIIERKKFYSSKKPLKEFKKNKAKDKTKYLSRSIITLENQNNGKKLLPEWHEPTLKFRMKIEYNPNKVKIKNEEFNDEDEEKKEEEKKEDKKKKEEEKKINKKRKWFVFYFKTEEEMYEVKGLLFDSYNEENTDTLLIDNLKLMNNSIENSFNFYGILKILSVKEKIKKRKRLLNKLKTISNKSINSLLSFGQNTQNKK